MLEHLDRVVLDDANVAETALADVLEQRAHARRVHLDAEEVVAGQRLRNRRCGVPHAEADLDHQRRGAAEGGRCVEGLRRIRHDELRPQVFERPHLPAAHATGAHDE